MLRLGLPPLVLQLTFKTRLGPFVIETRLALRWHLLGLYPELATS